jgi:hypothetical protein
MTTFTNGTGTISDRSPNNDQHSHRDDELALLTSAINDSPNDTIEFPYHGSCPKCHHLHTNVPFAVALDPSRHTRFRCEDCGHQIFGFGRTSTQTTLASIESTGKRTSTESARSAIKSCQNSVISPLNLRIDPAALPEQTVALDKLSTISEANSPAARSRSTSEVPALRGSPPRQVSGPTKHGSDPRVPPEDGTAPLPEAPASSGQIEEHKSTNFKNGYGVKQWARKRLFGRSKELRIPGLGLQVRVQITRKPSKNTRPGYQTATDTPIARNARPNIKSDVTETSVTNDVSDLDQRISHAPAAAFNSSESLAPLPGTPEASENRVYLAEASQRDPIRTKQERIQIKRRRETLKRKATEQPRCECTDGCHCLKDSQRSSFASNDRRTLLRNPEAPPRSLGRPSTPSDTSDGSRYSPSLGISPALAGLGSHLSTERSMSSSAENSSTVAESSRAPSRLSQTTAVDGSTASLHRRPVYLSRSASMPASESRRQRIPHQELLQHPGLLAQYNRFAREADAQRSSPRTYDGDDSNPSESTESSRGLQDLIPDHATSTSLANSAYPGQIEAPPHDGGAPRPSPSIRTPAAGDSQELTPRPSSFHGSGAVLSQPTQAAPERLSSALWDVLADGVSEEA